jgi:micrococcal nuclease
MKTFALAALVTLATAGAALAQDALPSSAFIVVDGDTIKSPAGVRYRLVGFDCPETFRAKCDEELALGLAASRLDKYGRTLATLTVNGRDVGEVLISEGLARAYKGRKRESWCPH